MAYNIFIDTSIFDNQCFDFDNRQFKGLEKLRRNGLINIFITDVIKAEVENRIKYHVKNEANIIRKDARILNTYFNPNSKEIIDKLTNEFHEFIAKNIMVIDVPESRIGKKIISNYLNNMPPFDTAKEKKKQEFPDAFIIETIADYLETNDLTGIFLSGDNDCKTYIDDNNRLSHVKDIKELLDKLNRENDECTNLIKQSLESAKSNLDEVLTNFINSLDIDNYSYETNEWSHFSFLDFDISSADYVENSLIINKNEYEIYDINPETMYAQLSVPVSYQVDSVLYAEDFSCASYDKEDGVFYNVETVEVDNRFNVEEVEIDLELDLSTGEFEIISESNEINAEFNIDEPLEDESEAFKKKASL